MVKSMFAAVAGLRSHQSKMDVIGNNIANVNTWGYKAGSMSFKDTMYQTTASGSGGSTDAGSYGGTNANQIGYGVTTGSITYDFGTGGMSPSSRNLDCMIDGSGFFFVGPMHDGPISLDSEDAIQSSGLKLSRVGKFDVDSNGYLVDDSGYYVYGFVNNGDLTSSDSFNTEALQPLRIPTTADMTTVKNSNASSSLTDAQTAYDEAVAALHSAQLEYTSANADYLKADTDYNAAAGAAGAQVPLPATASQGIEVYETAVSTAQTAADDAYRAWQLNTNPADDVSLKDDYHDARMALEEAQYNLVLAKADLQAPDALGTFPALTIQDAFSNYQTAYLAYYQSGGSGPLSDVEDTKAIVDQIETALSTVEPDSLQGKLDAAKLAADTASAAVTAAQKTVTEKNNSLTSAQDTATSTASSNTTSDDTLEEMSSYTILNDGTVTGVASDGTTVILGKIALAGVQNTSGLEKDSGYYYSIGANAGNVSAYEAGGSEGKILGNYLEMAKVDLATEMTDMITTQRGFQANSKIITVTDSMLEELVNMKR